MIVFIALASTGIFCAVMAVRAIRLLHSALWLAGVSVTVALMLYLLGAYVMAVIELSLSVGVITILLVFAISMVGADSPDHPVKRLPNIPLVVALLLLIVCLTIPLLSPQSSSTEPAFAVLFWQQREADVLAQISLIFAGVLGVLGLLAETVSKEAAHTPVREQTQPEMKREITVREEEPELERV